MRDKYYCLSGSTIRKQKQHRKETKLGAIVVGKMHYLDLCLIFLRFLFSLLIRFFFHCTNHKTANQNKSPMDYNTLGKENEIKRSLPWPSWCSRTEPRNQTLADPNKAKAAENEQRLGRDECQASGIYTEQQTLTNYMYRALTVISGLPCYKQKRTANCAYFTAQLVSGINS